MRKRFKRLIVIFATSVTLLIGCTSEEEILTQNISELKAEVSELKNERDRLQAEIIDTKIQKGVAKYVITFKIKQTHFTCDINQHLKDSMNEISIQIPVDKEYYDSVDIGSVINNDFRMGSFIFKGSIGKWEIKVKDKEII